MDTTKPPFTPPVELIAMLSSTMTEQQIESLIAMGSEAIKFALLTLQAKLTEALNANAQGRPSPSTPSGSVAPYLKPESKTSTKAKRGARPNHRGVRRPAVPPDKTVDCTIDVCPECGGKLTTCRSKSSSHTHCVTDIASDKATETTEYVCHKGYCPRCKKVFEPKVGEALPRCSLGNKISALSAWLHYSGGCTVHQVLDLLNYHLSTPLTEGGLMQIWARLAEIFKPWYDEIQDVCNRSGVLHGDETGWRVDGKLEWLWCFTTQNETYYFIVDSRGSDAIKRFFNNDWTGVLVSDFWNAYNHVEGGKAQKCLVHLLRELKRVENYKSTNDNWATFKETLKTLLQDAFQLKRDKAIIPLETYVSSRNELERRLDRLLDFQSENVEVKRLVKRLRKYRASLLTFLYHDEVPFDNNHAERNIRPAVLMRKNSYGNQSQNGAEIQSILMSVFRTLRQRKLPPLETLQKALRTFILTDKLPSLAEFDAES